MSMEKSDAIVLRSVPWSETSIVVTLLTKDFGRISGIAKGARRLRGPFDSALDLLCRSHVVFIAKSGDSLDLLTEAKLSRRFRSGQIQLLPLYCGYYIAELLFVLTENHQRVPDLFELTDKSLIDLDNGVPPRDVIVRFEVNLLRLLGHMPSFDQCVGCGESVATTFDVAVGIASGGVLCNDCSPKHRHVVRVETKTIDCLRHYATHDWSQPTTPIDASIRGEVRFVMERFLCNLADRRLRLMDFLEELKR